MQDQDAAKEQRAHRCEVSIPVRIESERGERVGMTCDLSCGGALLLANSRFEVGEHVAVTLAVGGELRDPPLGASVVGVVRRSPEVYWRYAVAVEFAQPLADGLVPQATA